MVTVGNGDGKMRQQIMIFQANCFADGFCIKLQSATSNGGGRQEKCFTRFPSKKFSGYNSWRICVFTGVSSVWIGLSSSDGGSTYQVGRITSSTMHKQFPYTLHYHPFTQWDTIGSTLDYCHYNIFEDPSDTNPAVFQIYNGTDWVWRKQVSSTSTNDGTIKQLCYSIDRLDTPTTGLYVNSLLAMP